MVVDAAVHELPATVLAAAVVEGEGAGDGVAVGADVEVHGGVPVVGVAGHDALGGGSVDLSLAVLAGPAVGAAVRAVAGGGAGRDLALFPSGLLVSGVAPWLVLGGIEVGDSAVVLWECAVGVVAALVVGVGVWLLGDPLLAGLAGGGLGDLAEVRVLLVVVVAVVGQLAVGTVAAGAALVSWAGAGHLVADSVALAGAGELAVGTEFAAGAVLTLGVDGAALELEESVLAAVVVLGVHAGDDLASWAGVGEDAVPGVHPASPGAGIVSLDARDTGAVGEPSTIFVVVVVVGTDSVDVLAAGALEVVGTVPGVLPGEGTAQKGEGEDDAKHADCLDLTKERILSPC